MLTREQIIEAVEGRLDEAAGQCNSGWSMHNDGVIRGLLWALAGEDPGCHLLSRVKDVLVAIGARFKEVGDHFHYALPGVDDDLDDCELCEAESKRGGNGP